MGQRLGSRCQKELTFPRRPLLLVLFAFLHLGLLTCKLVMVMDLASFCPFVSLSAFSAPASKRSLMMKSSSLFEVTIVALTFSSFECADPLCYRSPTCLSSQDWHLRIIPVILSEGPPRPLLIPHLHSPPLGYITGACLSGPRGKDGDGPLGSYHSALCHTAGLSKW